MHEYCVFIIVTMFLYFVILFPFSIYFTTDATFKHQHLFLTIRSRLGDNVKCLYRLWYTICRNITKMWTTTCTLKQPLSSVKSSTRFYSQSTRESLPSGNNVNHPNNYKATGVRFNPVSKMLGYSYSVSVCSVVILRSFNIIQHKARLRHECRSQKWKQR